MDSLSCPQAFSTAGGSTLAFTPGPALGFSPAAVFGPRGVTCTAGSHPAGRSCWTTSTSPSSPFEFYPRWSSGHGNASEPHDLLPSTAPAPSLPGTTPTYFLFIYYHHYRSFISRSYPSCFSCSGWCLKTSAFPRCSSKPSFRC